MLRNFETHKIREEVVLNGIWDFYKINEEKEVEKNYKLPVPSCWEQHPDLLSYRGRGEYRKKIILNEDTPVLKINFKGVSHTAKVYFDNEFVKYHYNAYTPFDALISNVKKGEHEIIVQVDNRFTEESSLHIPNDYYSYGGLTRGVAYSSLPSIFLEQVHFEPLYEQGQWKSRASIYIYNTSSDERTIDLRTLINSQEEIIEAIKVPANDRKIITLQQEHLQIEKWQPENPKLYFFEVQLIEESKIIDDKIERVGFRTIEMQNNRILLNGEPIFLKGFNRHEDYADFGCAIPFQLMVKDLEMMQDMGANAVRTCHYPNDELFLDLCDERGILVWEENHARGLGLTEMLNPHFDKQMSDCNEEMVMNHYNHPSIIIWGILNECASETPEGRLIYQKQFDQINAMDRSRLTTFATCRHFTDICLDLPDIVSFNMYTGWYQDLPVIERHNDEMDWIESAGGQGKPIIVSEFGAGAIYGYRDRHAAKWSEERQMTIIKDNFEVYLNDDRLSGVFIWQFADCRITEENNWFAVRPRSYNNKGIVDEYRRPKMAYDLVKQYFK